VAAAPPGADIPPVATAPPEAEAPPVIVVVLPPVEALPPVADPPPLPGAPPDVEAPPVPVVPPLPEGFVAPPPQAVASRTSATAAPIGLDDGRVIREVCAPAAFTPSNYRESGLRGAPARPGPGTVEVRVLD